MHSFPYEHYLSYHSELSSKLRILNVDGTERYNEKIEEPCTGLILYVSIPSWF